MTVRPFDWRDFPALYRNRHQSTFLDSALVLTRGPLLVPGALFSYLAPAMGILTAVSRCDGHENGHLIGQVMHSVGAPYGHLTFLTPSSALDSPALNEIVEYMARAVGEQGGYRLLADANEFSDAFEALRRCSFAIYTRQRIWSLTKPTETDPPDLGWRMASSRDAIPIRSLYNNVVPGLVQQVEPFDSHNPRGLVYYQGDNLLAFVELKYGGRGIWANPIVHPDVENVGEWFANLFCKLPYRRSRPVYFCIRSYQSWLEPAIEDLGAEPGPRQAVMVKHLAIQQKAVRVFSLPALEGGHAEVSAPIVRTEINNRYGTAKDY